MKRNIELKEITGKTVEDFVFSPTDEEVLVSFTDDTFIVIGIRKDYPQDSFYIADVEFKIHDFLEKDLISISIYSAKELIDVKDGIRNRNQTLAEITERATYERLKIKYEGTE